MPKLLPPTFADFLELETRPDEPNGNEFRMVVDNSGDVLKVMVHPLNRDGETKDFEVFGDFVEEVQSPLPACNAESKDCGCN